MKNTIFRFMLVFGITMLLSSCLGLLFSKTHELTVDISNPAEKNAIVTFINDAEKGLIYVSEWNGINISESLYNKKSVRSNEKSRLTVPAGDNSFLIDIFYTIEKIYFSDQRNIELQYNLEAGKKYTVKGRIGKEGFLLNKKYFLFIGIYDGSKLSKEWKLAEFKLP